MTAIFISYRRSTDRHSAGRLRERLTQFFDVEDLFRDRESIPAGENWRDALTRSLGSAKACLVIIGPNWWAAKDDQGRQRLFQDDDWVRSEIEIALSRPGIRLIPVLVEGATLPAEQDLPRSIQGLLDVQAKRLSEENWEADSRELIRRVQDVTGLTKVRQRMISVLVLIAIGVVYSLVVAGVELSIGDAAIDTHLGYLAALVAAGFVALGRSFLTDPLKNTLVGLWVAFGFMLLLVLGAFIFAVVVWRLQYTAVLLDGILIIAVLAAASLFLRDAHSMVKRRS
jgi:hypothetical protein